MRLRVAGALDAVLEVRRRHLAPVVKPDAMLEVEGIDRAALTDLPFLGQVGNDLVFFVPLH